MKARMSRAPPPLSPRRLILRSRPRRTPRRYGSSSGGCSRPRFPTGPLRHLQLSRLHHRPRWGDAGTGGRPPPPRRDRERDTRPQVRRRVEPHAVRPLRRQRRLAGGTGDGAQPDPLDRPHRPGRADSHHQDPPAAVLRSGGTDHPLGAPLHFASPPGAGLGKPSSVAPWPGCKPFRSRPDGQPATDPTSPQSRATPVARVPCCVSSRHPAHRNSRIGP